LRTGRLELVRASLREMLVAGDLDGYRVVVETLANEFDPMEIAMAAVKMAQEAAGGEVEDDTDIPEVRPFDDRSSRDKRAPAARGGGRQGRAAPSGGRGAPPRRGSAAGVARLYIGAGRDAGVRPGDLVGAITGEAGISG